MQVQWFPGHMAKTLRQLNSGLKLVEGIVELRDARAPVSTSNPEVGKLAQRKRRFVVFTKADLADSAATTSWSAHFSQAGIPFFTVDPRDISSVKSLVAFLGQEGERKIKRYMVVGVPNVGKSTLINAIGRRSSTRTGDRPGVTRGLQWVNVNERLELLDTPGLLWPKFEGTRTPMNLSLIGSINEERFDIEEAALHLVKFVQTQHPGVLAGRYGVDFPEEDSLPVLYDYLEGLAKKRGFLRSGGAGDHHKMARALLKDFRDGTLGRFTLELPESGQEK